MANATTTQELQASILAAAKEEFAREGLKGARLQRIADAANVPKATLLYHFKSKTKLYQAVLETILSSWDQGFENLTPQSDPKAFFNQLIHAKVQAALLDPVASKLFAMEIMQGAPHLSNHLQQKVKPWFRQQVLVIEQWMLEGRLRSTDPARLIFLIWAATQHYADFQTQVLSLMNRQEFDQALADETSEFLASFLLHGLDL